MSMVAYLRRTSTPEMTALLADPDATFAAMTGLEPEDEELYDAFTSSELVVDLYKSWDAVHRLLLAAATGDRALEAVGAAVLGGHDLGDDLGYGPLRYLTADEVTVVAEALDRLDPVTLEQAVPRADFSDCYSYYPDDLDVKNGRPSDLLAAIKLVDEVRKLYRVAGEHGDAMLLWLT